MRLTATLRHGYMRKGYMGEAGVSIRVVWCLENIHYIFKTFSGTKRVAIGDSNAINFYLIGWFPIIKLIGVK